VKRPLVLVLTFVFIDVLGFSLILPLLPYYAETFDATPAAVGLLLGANALAQLIGAPIIGRLSDRYGRRPMLILSIAGTVTSFLILALANSLWVLFASRILDGLLGGNISLAQAYITDVTDEKNRARGLGLVAAGLSAVNLLGVLLWLPESLPPEKRNERVQSPRSEFTARALWEALHRPCVGPLLNVQLLYALAFTAFETMFSLFALERLGLDAQATSYVLTYVGLLVVAIQGGGMGLLTKRFSEKQLIFGGSILVAITLLGWALTPTVWWLLVILAPLALASGVLRVSINSALTKSVYPEEVGGALGLSAALSSLARVVSPVFGAFLLDNVSTAAPGILASMLMLLLVPFTWRQILFVPDLVCPAEV
jgi:DHA1 family tetracycline resistance protein-like MFS transporter